MKVALIHDWLNGMRGGEKVLEVFCELYPDADVFTLFYEPAKISDAINRMKVIPSGLQRIPFARRYYRYLLPLFPRAISRFDLSGYDLVLSSSHCVAKGVTVPAGIPHLCYCYSPMRYIWDLYDAYFGGERRYGLGARAMPWFRRRLQHWDVQTAQRVDLFVAISRHIAGKIRHYYGRESQVVHPPVDAGRFAINPEGPADYFLIVSALTPYKAIDLAVRAFNELGPSFKHRLIVAGRGPEEERLRRLAGPRVEFRGWVGDAELTELYARCQAFILPGPEDFGIAPLEAMAAGRPAIALKQGGALETIVENRTGAFFEEPTAASLKNAIESFNTFAYDPAILRAHAEKFGRPRFVSELRSTIEDFLAGHRRDGARRK